MPEQGKLLLLLLLLFGDLSIYCQVCDIHSLLLWLLELLCPPFPRGKSPARYWGERGAGSSQPYGHLLWVTPQVDAFPDLPRTRYLSSP